MVALSLTLMESRARKRFAWNGRKCLSHMCSNAEQIDGIPPAPYRECSWNPLEKAEQLIQAANPKLEHASGDRAYYRPSTDSIHLPLKEQFPSAGDYYSTLLHELGHWTGHATRLNRDLSDPFGSIGYAREELRAEIASMIIGSELEIGYDPGQHVLS